MLKKPVHHTNAEKLALRRKKRREGPSALKRKAARAHLQPSHNTAEETPQ